jgi:hypothetical protein
MTDSPLKSVVVLDPETQAYRPSAHNLSASDATNLAQQLLEENRRAKIVEQKERHRTSDPTKCRPCTKAAAGENDANQLAAS